MFWRAFFSTILALSALFRYAVFQRSKISLLDDLANAGFDWRFSETVAALVQACKSGIRRCNRPRPALVQTVPCSVGRFEFAASHLSDSFCFFFLERLKYIYSHHVELRN